MLDAPKLRTREEMTPCLLHKGKGYKKGCKDCFELNRIKTQEEIDRDMGAYDGWND